VGRLAFGLDVRPRVFVPRPGTVGDEAAGRAQPLPGARSTESSWERLNVPTKGNDVPVELSLVAIVSKRKIRPRRIALVRRAVRAFLCTFKLGADMNLWLRVTKFLSEFKILLSGSGGLFR
jgi:hypothetical protein